MKERPRLVHTTREKLFNFVDVPVLLKGSDIPMGALLICALVVGTTHGFVVPHPNQQTMKVDAAALKDLDAIATPAFGETFDTDIPKLKAKLLVLSATLDRGQVYNPTSGEQYKDRMDAAVGVINDLVALGTAKPNLESLAGRWELVFSSVPHGIFRSSPFFLAIDNAYRSAGEPEKAELFFKLHELQTCSWGVSKIGRVAQVIDPASKMLYSEFDTQLFALTVIPILGWFKLLPTFGGCVVTASKITDSGGDPYKLHLEVDYTAAKPVNELPGLGDWIWNLKVPVGAVWKLLPWNNGHPPTCDITLRYIDDDFRIVQDASGDFFVYARPVVVDSLTPGASSDVPPSEEEASSSSSDNK